MTGSDDFVVPELPLGLAFDDVLLVPLLSQIASRSLVTTRTRLAGDIELEVPLIASNMDTVTGSKMAIAMARLGGIAFLHRFQTIEEECRQVERVKRYRSHVIADPYEIAATATVAQAQSEMRSHGVGGLMVVDDQRRLVGIVTTRDVEYEDTARPASEVMTPRERMVVGDRTLSSDQARDLMHSRRVEKLPLLDDDGRCDGLIVMKDIRKLQDYPNSTLDAQGRLMVGGSIGVVGDYLDRAAALIDAGADTLIVDVAHGHADHALRGVAAVRKRFSEVPLIAGNGATPQSVIDLAKAGADAVRLGIGPGCFAAGTRILMANGTYKNIEDVHVGDRVINMAGIPVNVVGTRESGLRKVMSYRHTAFHDPTYATPDHLHFVGNMNTVSRSTLQSAGYVAVLEDRMVQERKLVSRLQWRELGELDQDAFLVPRDVRFELPESFCYSLAQYARRPSTLRRIKPEIAPSYELGYVFGTFLGDGHSHITANRNSEAGSVHWAFGHHEQQIAAKLQQALLAVTGLDVSVTPRDNTLQVSLYSLPWARLLGEFGKRTAKHLPTKYLCGDERYLQGLYDGLIDSDGHVAADGRVCFDNTSPQLIELFGVLCQLINGSFPNSAPKRNEASPCGNLVGAQEASMSQAYVSRLNVSHAKRLLPDYQVVKALEFGETSELLVPTYDIEVDCPTHSFIANNVIVHNSACSTREVAGAGYPQFTALQWSAQGARAAGIPIIADGGIRKPGDLVKAIGAGAHTAMLGSMLAGTPEAPGRVIERNGQKYKVYRGMASMGAFVSKQMAEGGSDEAAADYTPEGVESSVPLRDSAERVVKELVGGLRSGMSYAGAQTIEDFHAKAQFVRMTESGRGESRPHVLER